MIINRFIKRILQSSPLWLQISAALILAMMLVGYATNQFGHDKRAEKIETLLKAESFHTLEIFSAGALEAVISEDIGMLETLVLETTRLEQNLISVSIMNSVGDQLIDWKKNLNTAPERAYQYERMISFEGDVYGEISTTWDPAKLESTVDQQMANERLRMMIALFSLTALSLLLVNFLVTVPLSKIENRLRALSEYSDENTAVRPLQVSNSREMAVLSTAVNELQRSMDASRRMADELDFQARHDYLTGLANRFAFEQELRQHLSDRSAESPHDMLLFIDLDQFKVVNDTCGHAAGDMLLQQLSRLLEKTFPSNATVARLGGDEFAVLIRDTTQENGVALAERLRSKMEGFRFTWQDRTFSTGASIGAVDICGMGTLIEDTMSAADVSCFAAKSAGRNRVHLYENNVRDFDEHQSEMSWVPRIQSAMENNDFVLFGQIIEPTASHSLNTSHVEILLRIQDGDDLIPPGAFLPAAERYNVITPIDRWVVTQTLDWMSAQLASNGMSPRCAINISGASIGDEQFHAFLLQALRETNVPGNCICFEITETSAVANFQNATEFMRVIKKFDCQFALDDFGAGMSSFSYLKSLPVDFVKIDGSFVRELLDDEICRAMVKALAEVSAVMQIQSIAEFVESDAIRLKLEELGIDYVQGYGVGKPKPLHEFESSNSADQHAA